MDVGVIFGFCFDTVPVRAPVAEREVVASDADEPVAAERRTVGDEPVAEEPVVAPPAPTCNQTRAPCAEAVRRAATKSTGAVACRTQISRASPYASPVMALTTGARGGPIGCRETSSRIAGATPSSSGEWNACDTSSCVTGTPAASSFAEAALTPAVVPEITHAS